jgi:hypothetical protein
MDSAALALSADLRDELAASGIVDPRSVPCRFSTLKKIQESPAHYLDAVLNEYDETLSMRIGSGAHAILFDQPYTVWTGKTRNGKAWDAFEAEHAGQTILNQSENAKAQAMAASIRLHSTASRLLFTNTAVENRIDWEWQGRAFRSTPDAAGRTWCVDLKCLRSADPEKVKWQSRNMGYHAQAAVYRRALNSTGKYNIKDNYLIVVENKRPYPVTVLRFTETAIECGDRLASGWLERVLACEASNSYPGYVQTIVDLEVPETIDDFIFDEDSDEGQTL